MRISHYQSGETPRLRVAVVAHESFGRIAAQRPARPSPILLSTVRRAPDAAPAPLSLHLESAARAHRARRAGELVTAAWHGAAAAARRFLDAWQRRRDRRATYLALRGLDDRTLHDLGFGRSEILSVAMDLDRDDETRRLRTMRAAHALRLF
jgi:uncharacterized protein YjiS (DUF1127 family)